MRAVARGGTWAGLCALIAIAGCGGPTEPGVEVRADEAWVAVGVAAYEVDGARDGDRTRVEVVYDLDDGSQLHLELLVFFNPRPVLEAGTWRLESGDPAGGPTPETGSVLAESLRFTGGQNEGPSLGGRFRLDGSEGPRFRVVMPLRPVRQPRWP